MSPSSKRNARDRKGARSHRRRSAHCTLVTLIATGLALLGLATRTTVAGASAVFTPPTPALGIVPFAGDVFTVGSNGSLITVDPRYTLDTAPLFNLGGSPLNLTWGQFRMATAKSYVWTVTHRGTTHTQFLIALSGLVPNGIYSLFYRTFSPDSNNALCPDVEPSIALPSAFPQLQKPDPDSFIATGAGKALYFASVPQDLLAAQMLQVSVVYHFDGKTYGPVANAGEASGPVAGLGGRCRSSYGIDAMRQFLIIQK
jgi:hypothetical protein